MYFKPLRCLIKFTVSSPQSEALAIVNVLSIKICAEQNYTKGCKPLKNDFLDTIFGSCPVNMSDADILDAMKCIPGYLDITPGDFKEIFQYAYRYAIERVAQSQSAKDVMTEKVIFATLDTSLKETAARMASHAISGIPVLDEGQIVVGVISEKDIFFHMGEKKTSSPMEIISQCLSSKGCVAVSMRTGFAKDIMTSPALTVFEDTSVFEIASIFAKKNINRVPVVDKKNHLVGIVARADIFRTTCAL
jgi:CBS domain-containing membrane protein